MQGLDGGAQGVEGVAVGGYADGRGADPVRPAVPGGQGGVAADPYEGVPGPGAAVLGGLQEEGAGAFGCQLAVEPDGGVPVGQQLAAHGDDAAVGRELAERLKIHFEGPYLVGCAEEDIFVEAGACPGVAGRPDLVDPDEHGVGVAVERDGLHVLEVTGRVPLHPVLLAAAGPVGAAAGGQGAVQGLVVHPAEHEHLTGVVLLGDGRDQPVRGTLEALGDGGVETAGAGDVLMGTLCRAGTG